MTDKEILYERALRLIPKGSSPTNGVGLHFDEITTIAEQVLVGETEDLELYESEVWETERL